MATERMRLEAEMKDSASPVVKKLRAELAALQDQTRETRGIAKLNKEIETLRKEAGGVKVTPGMRELPKWFGQATTGAQDFVKSGGGAAGVIGAMGIGGLTAAASLSSLVALMKEMGDRALNMKELGREVGMTVDQVNAFAHAGAHFGVGADVMKGAIDHLAGQMPEFRRNYGAMFQELSRWPDLIKKLQGEGTEDQIKDIFKFLGQAKLQNEPQLQKQILGALFGSGADMEKLFAQGAQGFLAELEKQKSQLGSISPEMLKQAQAFRDAQISFNDGLERFETTIGPGFLAVLTSILDSVNGTFNTFKAFYDRFSRDQTPEEKKADEHLHKLIKPPSADNPYATGKLPLSLFKKSSYSGGGGLLSLASYGEDTSGVGSGSNLIAAGTKAGVLAAFREMMATQDLGKGGGTAGLVNASYGNSNAGGIGAGTGGRGVGGGSSVPFRGNAGVGGWWTKDHIEHGIDRLMKEANLSRAGAEGLVSRWASVEAAGGPTSVNPRSGAAGIGQWLGSRRHGFSGDYDSQLGHAINELNGSEKHAGDALRRARNARDGAVGASMFERAEGYNPRSGTDNFTGKSEAGNAALHSRLSGGAPGSAGNAVDNAAKLLGKSGSDVGRAFGVHITPGEWCAEFVNGALKASGIKGTNSAMAGSFSNWGRAVASGAIKKGDVVVDGEPAGHVSLATGATRMKNGHLQIETLNGNWGHSHGRSAVMKDWLTAQPWVHARRATGLEDPAHAQSNRPAAGAKHHLDVHIHDRGGSVISAAFRPGHDGHVRNLTRWATMTDA